MPSPLAIRRSAVLNDYPANLATDSACTSLDQFYTRPEVADRLARSVQERWQDPEVLFVEPSAGSGAFLRGLKGRKVRAMDIAPAAPGIAPGNFLGNHRLFRGQHSATVVIGNPPFGKNCSVAVKFFNRAAEFADEIAFVVPRTFRKASIQKRLHRNFHLEEDFDLQDFAFLLDGKPHDVPCAWQTWKRSETERSCRPIPNVDHLISYTTPAAAHFAMRRVGFYAGRVVRSNLRSLSVTTHYFIKEVAKGVREKLEDVNWSEISGQTAGVRSLAKSEIALTLGRIYNV